MTYRFKWFRWTRNTANGNETNIFVFTKYIAVHVCHLQRWFYSTACVLSNLRYSVGISGNYTNQRCLHHEINNIWRLNTKRFQWNQFTSRSGSWLESKPIFFRKHLIWEKKLHNGMATMPTNTVNYSNTDNKIKQFWIAISWNIQFQLCVCRMHRIHIWNWKTHWGRSKNGYYLAIHVSKLIQLSSQSLSDNYLSLKLWELNWINYWFWQRPSTRQARQRPSTRQAPDHYPNQRWVHFKWILNMHLTMYGGTIN